MGADQAEFFGFIRHADRRDESLVQRWDRRERSLRKCTLRDPWRVLEHRANRGDELRLVHGVQLRQPRLAHARTAITRSCSTRAARAMSSTRLNSAGLWLMPSLLGTKSMAVGKCGARMAASWSAPLTAVAVDLAIAAQARVRFAHRSAFICTAGAFSVCSIACSTPRRSHTWAMR